MNYHNLTYPDMNNGEGLRVVLWLSGCSHKCKRCQNPQTWNENSGIPFNESAKEELFRELDKDYISGLTLSGGDPLFEENLDDVLDLVTEVNKRYNTQQHIDDLNNNKHNILNDNSNEIRLLFPQKTIWIYTGYTWEQLFEDDKFDINGGICENQIRRLIVLSSDVLIDGKYIDSQRDTSLPWRGSANQKVIDIKKSLQKGEIVIWQT